MVRPQLEYASDVWDPHYVGDIIYGTRKSTQQRVVRWVLNEYGRFSSVTSMLDQLSWPTLQTHHKISRLHILHSVVSSVITYNPSILLLTTNMTNETVSSTALQLILSIYHSTPK